MIRLIIFDWDDVIVLGSKAGYFKCYAATLKELGIKLAPIETKKRLLRKWGQPYKEELKELLKEKPVLLKTAIKIFKQHRFGETFYSNLKPARNVSDLLQELNKKYILAIATGSHPDAIKYQLNKFQIPNVFSQIISSHDIHDVKKTKPHPFMISRILENQKVNSQAAIYVGDAANDVIMARNAKVIPIVVLSGQLTRKEAKKLGADYIINELRGLRKLLEKINN